jgi:hypothetical protein
MTATGKKARARLGTRYDAKRAKARRKRKRTFGKLPYSDSKGNVAGWQTGALGAPVVDEFGMPIRAEVQ